MWQTVRWSAMTSSIENQCNLTYNTQLLDKIKAFWSRDVFLFALVQKLKYLNGVYKRCSWKNYPLRGKGKLILGVNLDMRNELLKLFHISAQVRHSGVNATMQRITTVVCWKGLKKNARILFENVRSANVTNMIEQLFVEFFNPCLLLQLCLCGMTFLWILQNDFPNSKAKTLFQLWRIV